MSTPRPTHVPARHGELRTAERPTPVRVGVLPAWFRDALTRWLDLHGDEDGYTDDALIGALLGHLGPCEWLMHWGEAGGAFVAEPFGVTQQDIAQLGELCRGVSATWRMGANAWHFPGRCVRIAIEPESFDALQARLEAIAQAQAATP